MRPLANTLAKIAAAVAIAESASSAITDDSKAKELYSNLEAIAERTLTKFPGKLSAKEIATVHNNLTSFFDRLEWDRKPKHAQTLMIFNTQQLEGVRNKLVEHKAAKERITAIDELIISEVAIYDYFVQRSGKEIPLCNMAGNKAADIWDEIWAEK